MEVNSSQNLTKKIMEAMNRQIACAYFITPQKTLIKSLGFLRVKLQKKSKVCSLLHACYITYHSVDCMKATSWNLIMKNNLADRVRSQA